MNDGFWNGDGTPRGQLLFGVVGEEHPEHPGTYRFSSTDGFVVNDAHILSPDTDVLGGGETTKPRPGSFALAGMTSDGAQCFILGFQRPPAFDEQSDDPPDVGNPSDNASSGDKVYKTAGGATFVLKRGGAIFVESGPGVSIVMNPLNNQMSLRSSNTMTIADGYTARRGREEIGKTEPQTFHEEIFQDQVGSSYDRIRLRHGNLDKNARRELELDAVTVVASQSTITVKSRETYFSDGSWVGEGPKYQWGGSGASENAVLGNQLVEVFGTLFDIIKNLKVNTAWGPSTPPLPPTLIDLDKLKSQLSDKILSTFLFFSKNPADL